MLKRLPVQLTAFSACSFTRRTVPISRALRPPGAAAPSPVMRGETRLRSIQPLDANLLLLSWFALRPAPRLDPAAEGQAAGVARWLGHSSEPARGVPQSLLLSVRGSREEPFSTFSNIPTSRESLRGPRRSSQDVLFLLSCVSYSPPAPTVLLYDVS